MNTAAELGAEGERAAVKWLREHGFLIVDTNWRAGRYELDIVAERGERLHFVEVKLRRAGGLTVPEEAMTRTKSAALIRAANAYIEQHAVEAECQIDLIAVDRTDDGETALRYIPEAVEMRW